MSLWTPSGEHPVDRNQSSPSSPAAPPGDVPGEPSLEDLSPEQRAQVEEMSRQMEAAQARMLAMPVGVVVAQQALQFFELAALYLSQDPPRLTDARIAIDALVAVAEKLGSRLGEAEQPLRQELNRLQLAFVQVAKAAEGGEPSAADETPSESDG